MESVDQRTPLISSSSVSSYHSVMPSNNASMQESENKSIIDNTAASSSSTSSSSSSSSLSSSSPLYSNNKLFLQLKKSLSVECLIEINHELIRISYGKKLNKIITLLFSDIIAIRPSSSSSIPDDNVSSSIIDIIAYPKNNKMVRKQQIITIYGTNDDIALLYKKSNEILYGCSFNDDNNDNDKKNNNDKDNNNNNNNDYVSNYLKSKGILVLINPASGNSTATKLFESIEQIFKDSRRPYDVIITNQSMHAYQLCKTVSLNDYNTILTVSGDGLLNEVLNGLLKRSDWETAIDHFSLGTLGGGSGNGLAKSICAMSNEIFSSLHCAYIAIKGYKRPLDIMSTYQNNNNNSTNNNNSDNNYDNMHYGFLSVSWAMISDIDLVSEKWRCMGGARFTAAAVSLIFNPPKYSARLQILPASVSTKTGDRIHNNGTTSDNIRIKSIPLYPRCTHRDNCTHCSTDENAKDKLSNYLIKLKQQEEEEKKEKQEGGEKKKEEEEKEDWVTIDEEFNVFWAMNVAHAATDMHTAPYAHISDGLMDIVYVYRANCCKLLPLFLDLEKGDHIQSSALHYQKCKAFRLIPTDEKMSELVLDGEKLPYNPIEVRVWQGLAKLCAK